MGRADYQYSGGKIIQLAREIGSAKPAYICRGWGPQRHSNGEQTARAIAMLSVLTGNVGINGGNSGVREGTRSGRRMVFYAGEPGKNPDFGLYGPTLSIMARK